jgi:ElaB/YqjD/DUF883 family membrane-anchored ribosome-binding protein
VNNDDFMTSEGGRAVEEARELREQAARGLAKLEEQLERHR